MIKILHSADWHMDAPLRQFTDRQRKILRQEMLALPGKIADVAIREDCDLCLLSGDIFDSHRYTAESVERVRQAIRDMKIPVLVSPGNHDFYSETSPWFRENWPENLYIFKKQELSSVSLQGLDCRVYGAAFTAQECPALLEDFQAGGDERYALLVVHGDPNAADSAYNPVTAAQIREAGLDYAALGHIHAAGRFGAGAGMCAWPGCPMGRGFDETGVKGVLVAELDETADIRFIPLDVPKFYDHVVEAGENPVSAVLDVLPGGGSADFIRVKLRGEVRAGLLDRLKGRFERWPNLTLINETIPAGNIWETAGEDSLEGLFFQMLLDAREGQDPQTARELELAARIAQKILRGQEVELP